ncbi:MAG: SAM-dependent methyltransferase, partial [Actinomycetota bacterium]|nr:SAM-dependent methyltransferase [Actinomycetota bacterium]
VTKPGGSVSAYVWDLVEGGAPFESIMVQMRSLDIDSPRPPSAEISEQSRLVETWNDAGLTNVEVKRISVDRTFTNFTEFWDIALLAPPVGSAFSPLDPDVGRDVRRMTQEFLGVDDTEPVTIHGFANAIKGTC